MSEEEEILGAFLLVNDYRILTNEELENVKKAINILQQQLKDKDEKISKMLKKLILIQLDREVSLNDIAELVSVILGSNKED